MTICPICQVEFNDPKHKDRKYCSLACSTESQKRRVVLICKQCQTEFVRQAKHAHRQFCSKACEVAYKRANPKVVRHACPICGKEMVSRSCRPKTYCSQQCLWKSAERPDTQVTLQCVVCNKDYKVHEARVKNGRNSTCCSRDCFHTYLSQIKAGAGNPNYRGGTIKYRGPNWGRQRRKAIARDGMRCQACHRKIKGGAGRYGVHHIKPYRSFNGDYKRANDLSNLIVLCVSCHSRVEFGDMDCPQRLF